MTTFEILHPGVMVLRELDYLRLTQSDAAVKLGIKPESLNRIIKGHSPVTPDFALRMERAFQLNAEMLLKWQAGYDKQQEEQAQIDQQDEINKWADQFPLNAMYRLGMFPVSARDRRRGQHLLTYFQVASVEAYQNTYPQLKLAAKGTHRSDSVDMNTVYAWMRHAVNQSNTNIDELGDYTPSRFADALDRIRPLLGSAEIEAVFQAMDILRTAGVHCEISDSLPGLKIGGVTYWEGKRPVICISTRGKRLDTIWFTLLHEIAHILLHGHQAYVTHLTEQDPQIEHEANAWAANFLISPEDWLSFTQRKAFSRNDMIAFACQHKLHPCLVLGRLQKEQLVSPAAHRQLHIYVNLSSATKLMAIPA
ncbi:MAG: HigA family addiction module antitoxin [Armatimonadota bacterium]